MIAYCLFVCAAASLGGVALRADFIFDGAHGQNPSRFDGHAAAGARVCTVAALTHSRLCEPGRRIAAAAQQHGDGSSHDNSGGVGVG